MRGTIVEMAPWEASENDFEIQTRFCTVLGSPWTPFGTPFDAFWASQEPFGLPQAAFWASWELFGRPAFSNKRFPPVLTIRLPRTRPDDWAPARPDD